MDRLRAYRPSILVIGDVMLDHYLWGKCERISPEAPVQVVDIKKETTVLGGAGNVINNLIALDCEVFVLSAIGDDATGDELSKMLLLAGAKSLLAVEQNRKTSKKSRIIAAHQQVVRYDNESKNDVQEQTQNHIIEKFKNIIGDVDVVLLSDYGKGVLAKNLCEKLIKIANEHNKKVLVDPKGEDYSKYKNAYLLTPNKKEASIATKIKINNEADLLQAIAKLKNELNLGVSVVTLSEDGIAIFDDKLTVIPTAAREVFDVTGAGDTVLAALGYMTALANNIYESVEFANLAAGVVVAKIGSATATLDEIEEYKSSLHKSPLEDSIKTHEQIEKISTFLKEKNKKVVFTNGCFDILHRGHVEYLKTARSFGDALILGLNSDASVRTLKGPSRPINNQFDRAIVLSALESVDFVVIFDEETPYELIKLIKPDILVKGGDYEGKEVVGSDVAKEVKLVTFVDGKSTTTIINKINNKDGTC